MTCKICNKEISEFGILCEECNNKRLAAASFARILSGRGLNFENAEAYSQENWVKANAKH